MATHRELLEEGLRTLLQETPDHREVDASVEAWLGQEEATRDLANQLSEQLRLILAPTLASQLRGDYRTGKRLSMRRIIPYIASEYRKDRIWLRRTRPARRQYQVLLAVDDSKSMREGRSAALAIQTLALLSGALSHLDVGELGVLAFGDRVRLLHPLGTPISSEAGGRLLRSFSFDAPQTDISGMLQGSLALLEEARGRMVGPAGESLWQLEIILSDGVCQDHDRVRSLCRRAAEARIMLLFIILDDKPEDQSILRTSTVKYEMVDGKMQLKMTRYMEDFPFAYYVVLRDLASLPSVVADALRQFFVMVQGA
ncbi:hypothetical protein BJ684DRAFT_8961 [Piptocephalis cylindrospora]|uniref:VWFA domain-containing protein n=1 Tax=Piptocephalis cylindrospora TaxID=1907219 RepID=A0A4V1IYD6_9FUNG|nr:hypothetical protein BJ684DRAFT_8961 [Piptocephalis cylindrospora]|eukprot:RKP14189.1 hypothetical protein BJ684DRAFT_8961 [Piptocephalis cylindrospora]